MIHAADGRTAPSMPPAIMQARPQRQKRSAPARSQNRPKKIAPASAMVLNVDTSQPVAMSESPNSDCSSGSAGDILLIAPPETTPAAIAARTAGQWVLVRAMLL